MRLRVSNTLTKQKDLFEPVKHETIANYISAPTDYNTLTKQKELFEPVKPGKIGIYLCGPTVYKPPHVGHLVGPVIFDAIKRYLAFKGYDVTWVVNITDVEDKLIDAAKKQNATVEQLAERHAREYHEALAA